MRLFYTRTNTSSPANALIYAEGKTYDAIYKYSVAGTLASGDLSENLVARCQSGLSEADVLKADFLHAFGGIPVFSDRFLDVMHEAGKEIEYIRTHVVVGGRKLQFNLGKILNRVEMLNYEKSGIGTDNFLAGTHFRSDLKPGFLIAREANPLCQSVFAVSDAFVALARKNALNIHFKEVVYA